MVELYRLNHTSVQIKSIEIMKLIRNISHPPRHHKLQDPDKKRKILYKKKKIRMN